jgi:geranylgeranyl diphosphate synthase type II
MVTAASTLVRGVLEEYGALARTALRAYLRPPEPRNEIYDLVSDYPQRGGRSLRASMCIASARAFGAPVEDAVNSAVALELMHNAFLIHDDVEDESEERRGRPTMHKIHGVPIAINVGDALTVLSLRPLIQNRARLGPRIAMRVLEETERMARETVEGQAIELSWRHDNAVDLGEADYLRMILKKTCWYTTIYPCRVGALIGTRDGVELDRYLRFGFFLGAAFQIQDDLLNLLGDETLYGKELNGDIWEGKRTIMLIRLFGVCEPEERLELRRIFGLERGQRTRENVRWVRELMEHYGCTEYTRDLAHGLAGAAMHEFGLAFPGVPDSRDKRFLEALATWVIERA